MSKIREDYEKTFAYRFKKWVKGDISVLTAETVSEKVKKRKIPYKILEKEKLPKVIKVTEIKNRSQNISLKSQEEKWVKKLEYFTVVASVIICLTIITVLLVTISYLPKYGNPDNPENNEVSERYITKGMQETGSVNIVTGMILDYRAFDTFGESNVLFIASCCVLILLRVDRAKDGRKDREIIDKEQNDRLYEPKNDVILQTTAYFLVPMIMIFGIYVILNGHLSPGGGFSGGAIIGAGLILYLNAFGFQKTEKFFTEKTFRWITFGSLTFYSLAKSYSFFTGANHIESGIPIGTPGDIISAGLILPLNICVGLVVACTMYAFYAVFRKGSI